MGPNGSGKSTLANTLLASPEYEVTGGPHPVPGRRHHRLAHRRAGQGRHVPGLPVPAGDRRASRSSSSCARPCSARKGIDLSVLELRLSIMEWMKRLGMDSVLRRPLPQRGLLGRREEAQRDPADGHPRARAGHPRRDRLRASTSTPCASSPAASTRCASDRPELGIVLITHYQRLLDELTPDHVHILVDGRIVAVGRPGAGRARSSARATRRSGEVGLSWLEPDRAPRRRRAIRKDFPLARPRTINGAAGIVYLDSAAHARQKPRRGHRRDDALLRDVLRADPPQRLPARRRGHRGLRGGPRQGRPLHQRPPAPHEVVFTKNATEALNLVAQSWGRANLRDGRRRGAHPDGAPRQHRAVADAGRRAGHRAALGARSPPTASSTSPTSTALLDGAKAFCVHGHVERARHASRPVRRLADAAHAAGARRRRRRLPVRAPHRHRRAGHGAPTSSPSPPTRCAGRSGIGVLWGREELLDAMPPFLGGGNMIADVRLDGFTPAELPAKFEAGTPPITEAVGFGAAVDYLQRARHGQRPRPTRWSSPATPSSTLKERFGDDITHPRPDQRRGARRRAQLRLPRPPPPRRQPGARPAQRVRAGRPPLRQAADARARRRRHRPGQLLRLQRRATTSTPSPTPSTTPPTSSPSEPPEGPHRHARPRRPLPRDHPRPLPQPPEPGRAARRRRPHSQPRASTRCAATRSSVYLDVDDGVVTDVAGRRPGLLDQPELGVDDVGQAVKGKIGRRGPRPACGPSRR